MNGVTASNCINELDQKYSAVHEKVGVSNAMIDFRLRMCVFALRLYDSLGEARMQALRSEYKLTNGNKYAKKCSTEFFFLNFLSYVRGNIQRNRRLCLFIVTLYIMVQ